MKILVISRNAWDETNAIGNTLSNFFKGIDNLEFANIYFRTASPNNNLCKRYYRVTETEVMKKWFTPRKIGSNFVITNGENAQKKSTAEKKERTLVRFIHKHNLKLAYKFSDYIWYSQKWLNKNLKDFIEAFAPDIMITFVKSAPQYYLTIKYLRENFHIPLFTWIADDEYTGLLKNHSLKEIENLRYILNESALVCGCSQEICDYYNSVFACKATPLYKGCNLSTPIKDIVNQPIRIVYAGNLLYGRLDVIRRIADTLEKYNDRKKVSFEIYSNTLLTSEEQKFFKKKCCSKYFGSRDYKYITQRLAKADIVLHVESFDLDQILKTKYSFSTKIIDCLQSGSIILAVGPSDLASINYIKQIPGSFVIDIFDLLDENLCAFLDDTASFVKRAKNIREYASVFHDQKKNSEEIKILLERVVKGES